MPIDILVVGDPQSCRDCASALTAMQHSIDGTATSFKSAVDQSHHDWRGGGGDGFRGRIGKMQSSTSAATGQLATGAAALNAFADDLTTAKGLMGKAREIAAGAGIATNDALIADPVQPPPDASAEVKAQFAKQLTAYNGAASMAKDAREAERNAHANLQKQATGLRMLWDDAKKDPWWHLTDGIGAVSEAISQEARWTAEAAEKGKAAEVWRKVAGMVPDNPQVAETAAANFEEDAATAAKKAVSNGKWGLGLGDSPLGRALTATPASLAEEGSLLAKVGEKLPYVGVTFAAAQTGVDIYKDRHNGVRAITKDAVKDMGGFAVGSGTTALLLAGSAAGGPVTFAAVGAGVVAAYGYGEIVDHWAGISHASGTAVHAVGHFFTDVF